jgi:hypothetical protein
MSITVRVIFWGLMGFVPNEEGQRGLTALLVSPSHQEAAHIPAVYLYEGSCEGIPLTKNGGNPCVRVPDPYKQDVATHLGATAPGLRWLLQNEDLEILGEESRVKLNTTGRKTLFGRLREAPASARQTAAFTWVPSMATLTAGHGQVRDDCLFWVGTCPLSARFKVRGGKARTCHLFHTLKADPRSPAQEVVVFSYRSENGKPENLPPPQAVADAVQLEFEVEGDYVELGAWDFPGLSGQQTLKAAVKLRPPAGSRTLTLIVSNGPQHSDDEEDYTGSPHQEALFNLLARQPVFRFTRDELRTEWVAPGTCEREITALANATFDRPNDKHAKSDGSGSRKEVPHATTACDGATYP